ncbi:2-hydroxychromene-2-carboxylate isomerase [Candidatus Pelagibacter sp.]|uniref:2-hydroxychromene-2-carboxylate isomerase n=1 Tax=Candidatus Pelagibacter sp. TaxID=2024849 RepID=UPI003F841238
MTKTIDFYFDVISPYTYLAHQKIIKKYKDKNINFNYKPILLGGLHKLAEIIPPAFNKLKMKNMKRDCELVANKDDIEFKWNDQFPINSINIMRGYLLVDDQMKEIFINKFFDAYWKYNINLNIRENFNEVLNNLKIDPDEYFNGIQSEKIKDELKTKTSEAFDEEVFGAPTFIVNNKLFWGQDRLEYAIDEFFFC